MFAGLFGKKKEKFDAREVFNLMRRADSVDQRETETKIDRMKAEALEWLEKEWAGLKERIRQAAMAKEREIEFDLGEDEQASYRSAALENRLRKLGFSTQVWSRWPKCGLKVIWATTPDFEWP